MQCAEMNAFVVPVACKVAVVETKGGSTCTSKRPYGYWKNRANVSAELRDFAVAHQHAGRMPTSNELRNAGRADIANAIRRLGKWSEAAEAAGLTQPALAAGCFSTYKKRPRGYWMIRANVSLELQEFAVRHGHPDRMPTQSELLAAGCANLASAVRRLGRWSVAAEAAGLRLTRSRDSDSQDGFMRMQAEVERFTVDGRLPVAAQLRKEGRYDLVYAIQKHGGFKAVAEKLGVLTYSQVERSKESKLEEIRVT